MKHYGQSLLEIELKQKRLIKLENINIDALWIDSKELLEDVRLGEPRQKYNKDTVFEHQWYDVLAFRELANSYYEQLKEDYNHLPNVIAMQRAYKKEIDGLVGDEKMEIFKNYLKCLALNKWGGVNHFYESKGKRWKSEL